VEALEQRPRKDIAAEVAADPAAENGLSEPEIANGHANGPQAPPGIYLVRVPKPPIDETALKATQAEFQTHVDKLKKFNVILQKKRDEMRELRKHMGEARSLKEAAEPEYQEKLERIKQLKDLRQTYLDRIRAIKSNVQDLDVRSEDDLDAKIRELEGKIASGSVPIREERQIVQNISKYNAMRGRIREYETQKGSLVELEAEANKIKAIVEDMDSEFKVIKTERNAANDVKKDIYGKLEKASAELKELEAEQADVVKAKNDALEQLQKIRSDMDVTLADYRENRKLSLEVRDLVAAGNIAEAREKAAEQVNAQISKLVDDTKYRKEYQHLWAQQRRFVVSELLPESSVQAQQASTSKAAPGKGGKGAAGAKPGAARAAPPVPRGKEKAASLIESIMAQATREVASMAAGRPRQVEESDDADDEVDVPVKKAEPAAAAKPSKPSEPAKLVSNPAEAAANAFNFKVEVPKVNELVQEFAVPDVVRGGDEEDDKAKRERLLEEQRRLAAEAEERKKRRAEQAERKRVQAAETAKRLEAERKERDRQAREAAAQAKAQAADDAANADTVAAEAAAASKPTGPTPFEKRQQQAAAKRPKTKAPVPLRTATKFWQQYQGYIILAITMLICVILSIMYLQS